MRSDYRAPLLRRRKFSSTLFSVTFAARELAREIGPGQFVMLEVPGRARPYLRRAYSVADADRAAGEVELLVRTVGPGTAALEEMPLTSEARLLGPLGNGFSLEGLARESRAAVVAGGIGAAPFPLLFRELARAGVSCDLFFGGRGNEDFPLSLRFQGIVSGETILASDDGSFGERGFVTQVFDSRARAKYDRLFACGPMPMFAALAPIVARRGIPSQFATEAAMGCGFGACLGCVIPGREKAFLISCQDGPVLAPEKIAWERL